MLDGGKARNGSRNRIRSTNCRILAKLDKITKVVNMMTHSRSSLRGVVVQMEEAVASAQEAFLSWRDVPVQHRSRVMFKLQGLIRYCVICVRLVALSTVGDSTVECSAVQSRP